MFCILTTANLLHGPVDELCDRTGMASKWPEQPPSLQSMGSCDSHQPSSQSLGCRLVEMKSLYRLYLMVHMEGFSMGGIGFLYREGVFKLIQDHITNELRN